MTDMKYLNGSYQGATLTESFLCRMSRALVVCAAVLLLQLVMSQSGECRSTKMMQSSTLPGKYEKYRSAAG